MNNEQLQHQIDAWEPPESEGAEVVRTIDIHEDTVERIVKHEGLYYLYRYFETRVASMTTIVCSVDLNGVSADRVIQELGERVS